MNELHAFFPEYIDESGCAKIDFFIKLELSNFNVYKVSIFDWDIVNFSEGLDTGTYPQIILTKELTTVYMLSKPSSFGNGKFVLQGEKLI